MSPQPSRSSPDRARLAAATVRSLLASPKHRVVVAEEELELEVEADLARRCAPPSCVFCFVCVSTCFLTRVLSSLRGAQTRRACT